jgi:hypothetical protein
MEATTLDRGERLPHEPLHARQRSAELLDVTLDEPRQQRREHELRDCRRSLRRRQEPPERVRLSDPREPWLSVRHDQDDPPLVRHRVTHEQGRRALHASSHAALDHEAAQGERPHPHRGARRAAGGLCEGRRVDRAPMHRDECLRHRKRQLRTRPEADVRRDRRDHAQMGAAGQPQRVTAAARERQRALRLDSRDGQVVARLGFDHHRRAADRYPEPAEAARVIAGDRKHAQMQARGRLDADRQGSTPSPTTARTWRVT